MDITWTDWQVVRAALAHGSFTAAAEALGVGQATVSRRVAAVEESLGHRLFDRHRHGLEPTAATRRLAPHLEALATAADGAARAVEGLEAEAAGEVRIAAPPGLSVDWMPRLALRLAESHPSIQLTVLADITPRDLDRREADIALRMMATERGDLLVRRLITVRGGVFATPAYAERVGPSPRLEDLDLIGYSADFAHIPLAGFIDSLGARIPLRSNDYLVQRAAIVAGLGAGLVSVHEARALGLVPLEVRLPIEPEGTVFLVVHRALRHVPRVAVVIDAIDALVAEEVACDR